MERSGFVVSSVSREGQFKELPEEARVVVSSGKAVVLRRQEAEGRLPSRRELRELVPPEMPMFFAGTLDGQECVGCELAVTEERLPEGLEMMSARSAFACLDEPEIMAVSRTRELVAWRNGHQFCGRCQRELVCSEGDMGLICKCGMRYYPQIAPAVIVAVSRQEGKELLLAHNRHFEEGVYGLIAGFVEAGETVEQAVKREIMEETGVEVKNIRYLYSQPWPFPNSLMLAFTAEYERGKAMPDGTELSELGWFSQDKLPKLPKGGSVARRVIEGFFNGTLPA